MKRGYHGVYHRMSPKHLDRRSVWDPHKTYQTYTFVRQPQTFPDVVLRELDNDQHVLMGIELKGWYLS